MENMVDYNLYKGKKVFLTGHTGFKGSWMLACLKYLGAEVRGFALEPQTNSDLYNVIDGNNLCSSFIGDIRDQKQLVSEIGDFQPDFVFHLAAQPLVRKSYEFPVDTFEINAIGTANLLNSIRCITKKCVVIIITTDKVYENKEWNYPYRENDQLGGFDPYSASKACAELIVSSFRNSYFNSAHISEHKKSIATVRAGNVIGGGDWAQDRIIPDLVKSIIKSRSIEVRNPKSIRPWQHVLEPVVGYLHLGIKMFDNPDAYNTAWNFGPSSEDNKTVEDLVKKAIEVWGKGEIITNPNKPKLHEASLLKLDISNTESMLDWRPQWNSDTAIEETISWYRHFSEQNENITFKQVSNYFKTIL